MLVVDVKIGCSRRRRRRVKWTLTLSVWYLSSSTMFERSGIGAEGNRGCGGGGSENATDADAAALSPSDVSPIRMQRT